ncbi:hypothetical protein K7W03_07535 [Sphingobium sp. PNB]|uniref:hypothetical protein n=1 Tax=Sphingobium sp. PNB TaxID=863934 RepID=UPI001CA3C8D9|nr:hypothetical protein [Sphingobium sp. PNB]MCB4859450.1 hypothetical protein [Sphingobium sp. PNB]
MITIAIVAAVALAGLTGILVALRRRRVGAFMAMLMLIVLLAVCGMALLYPAALTLRSPGR